MVLACCIEYDSKLALLRSHVVNLPNLARWGKSCFTAGLSLATVLIPESNSFIWVDEVRQHTGEIGGAAGDWRIASTSVPVAFLMQGC